MTPQSEITVCGRRVKLYEYKAVVVGSGAAGLNCADMLVRLGVSETALVTEGVHMGTSINTGSDKQTYYKLCTFGDEADSVDGFAKTLFSCGGIEGFHAMNEATRSLECFYRLCNIGVNFPKNDYGEYVGYRTDHDTRRRATSCGPLTSKYMCERLYRELKSKEAVIFEGQRAVQVVTRMNKAVGLLCLDCKGEYTLFKAQSIVLATGGEAGIYSASVYPQSQTGSLGIALEVGASAVNLTEWQYGIASVGFRWNLSGTYMQVIPRFVSIDENGIEREFLPDYIDDGKKLFDVIFAKGYNWPFSPEKLCGTASSLVDMAVFGEKRKGRHVFLDYTKNPNKLCSDYLSSEAKEYLANSGITEAELTETTPVARLRKMNGKAYELFLDSAKIDLEKNYIEIDVCAQHCNGGISVDRYCRVRRIAEGKSGVIEGLYAVGECAGIFGVKRPGGTALASSQVTSLVAAEHIASNIDLKESTVKHPFASLIEKKIAFIESLLGDGTLEELLAERKACADLMTENCSFLRFENAASHTYDILSEKLMSFARLNTVCDRSFLTNAVINRDILISSLAVCKAQKEYTERGFVSRGSFVIGDYEVCKRGEIKLEADCETLINISISEKSDGIPQSISFTSEVSRVSPLPTPERWFEKVYADRH